MHYILHVTVVGTLLSKVDFVLLRHELMLRIALSKVSFRSLAIVSSFWELSILLL